MLAMLCAKTRMYHYVIEYFDYACLRNSCGRASSIVQAGSLRVLLSPAYIPTIASGGPRLTCLLFWLLWREMRRHRESEQRFAAVAAAGRDSERDREQPQELTRVK